MAEKHATNAMFVSVFLAIIGFVHGISGNSSSPIREDGIVTNNTTGSEIGVLKPRDSVVFIRHESDVNVSDKSSNNRGNFANLSVSETTVSTSTAENHTFQLPAKWRPICDVVGMDIYKSVFTRETQLRVIKCTVSSKDSRVLNLHDLNGITNTTDRIKLSVSIQCLEYASVSVSWPLKIWNLYKISIKDCTLQEFHSQFNSHELGSIPDSLRVIEFINNVIMIPLSLFADLLTKVDEFSMEYNCGHEYTIERITMINQTEDFIWDLEVLPDIISASEEYMKDVRRIKHTCDFKHLMVIDESQSSSQSTYKMQVLIQHSIFDQLRVYNQSHSFIKSLKEPILHWSVHFPNLETFDLSWNNISGLYRFEVPVHAHPHTVTTINLQHNNISMVTIDQLDRLKLMPMMFVDIRNNPIECECSEDIEELLTYIHAEMYKNISKQANYSYMADLQCASPGRLKGVRLGDLQITESCLVETSKEYFVVPITVLVVAISLLSVLLLVVLRYRQYIQILLFTRFDIILPCQSRVAGLDKKYDAFVSYSSNDEDWIEEFFESLERKSPSGHGSHQFNFCMHHRDFIPGKTIFDNVINSVESSRHTIILLSKHYLGSEFCLYEFQEAFRQSIMEQKRHLIIIMMEDIPEVDLPRDLRRCIKTFTYIRKDDSMFTQRLIFALTVKQKSKMISSDKDFNSDLVTPALRDKKPTQQKSPGLKHTSKNYVGKIAPSMPSSNQINSATSGCNMVELTDIVKAASVKLDQTGVTNLAYVDETAKENNTATYFLDSKTESDVSSNASEDFTAPQQTPVKHSIPKGNIDSVRKCAIGQDDSEHSDMTSQGRVKNSVPVQRLDSFSKRVIDSKLIKDGVCYDRSISCLSQDTGYGSDRGSCNDRNLQEICETP